MSGASKAIANSRVNGAVEVASVGKVAIAIYEAVDVDDRYGDDRAGERARIDLIEDAANDLDAGDLVAVHRGAEPDGWALVSPVDHPQWHRNGVTGNEPGQRQVTHYLCTGRDFEVAALERLRWCHARPLFFWRTAFFGRPPRYDTVESTVKPWASAWRPTSIRKPISSRLVRVNPRDTVALEEFDVVSVNC